MLIMSVADVAPVAYDRGSWFLQRDIEESGKAGGKTLEICLLVPV